MASIPPPSVVPRSRRDVGDPQLRIAELERALRRATAEATAAKEEAYDLRRKVVRLEAEVQRMRSGGPPSTRISGDRISRPSPLVGTGDRPSGVIPTQAAGDEEEAREEEGRVPPSRLPVPRVR